MDQAINFFHTIVPALHVLAIIAIIIKLVLVYRIKGFSLPAFMVSFFRVYAKSDLNSTNSKKRQQFMVLNNYINFYLYTWVFITIVIFIIYHGNV